MKQVVGFIVEIMPSRVLDLRAAVAGYRESGVPLFAFDGSTWAPVGSRFVRIAPARVSIP